MPSRKQQTELEYKEMVENLVERGNEGLRYGKPHTCTICQKVLGSRSRLYTHIERIHIRTNEMHCEICHKIFYTLKHIRRHMQDAHIEKTFKCNVCDFKSSVKQNLQHHKLIHGAKVECPRCSKKVASLKKHMYIHKTPNNPKESAECPICHKVYLKSSIKNHIKIHDKWGCKKCSEKFEEKNELRT